MHIKKSTSSIGKLIKQIPVKYDGLNPQTSNFVKKMSQEINKKDTVKLAFKKALKYRLNLNFG